MSKVMWIDAKRYCMVAKRASRKPFSWKTMKSRDSSLPSLLRMQLKH